LAATAAVLCAVAAPAGAAPAASPAPVPPPPSGELTVPDGAVLVGPFYAELDGGVRISAISMTLG
jgi:hypothetical protein